LNGPSQSRNLRYNRSLKTTMTTSPQTRILIWNIPVTIENKEPFSKVIWPGGVTTGGITRLFLFSATAKVGHKNIMVS
jgi:hypothetical protein